MDLKKLFKKTLSVVLTVLIAITVFPTFAFKLYADDEYVAQIGDDKYETLAEAINAAANGQTIILLADLEDTHENTPSTPEGVITIPEEKNVIIDLNGHNVNGGTKTNVPAILNYGTVKITDTAENKGLVTRDDVFDQGSGHWYVIKNEGTMTLTNINVSNQGRLGSTGGASLIENGDDSKETSAQLTINGGNYYNNAYTVVKVEPNTNVTIKDGVFDSTSGQKTIQTYGTITVDGGSFTKCPTKDSDDAKSIYGTVKVNEAAFKYEDGWTKYIQTGSVAVYDASSEYKYQVRKNAPSEYDAKLTPNSSGIIKYFIGGIEAVNMALDKQLGSDTAYFYITPTNTKELTSGTYKTWYGEDVESNNHYTPTLGYALVDEYDENTKIHTYSLEVTEESAAACVIHDDNSITYYNNLVYAGKAAQAGETVKALKDNTESKPRPTRIWDANSKSGVIVDLAGKRVDYNLAPYGAQEITIIDSVGGAKATSYINSSVNGSVIVIKSGGYAGTLEATNGGVLRIEGGYYVNDPTAFVPDDGDYKVITLVDGNEGYSDGYRYKVVFANVAKINETKYKTLSEAIAAVKDNETITILTDIDDAVGLQVNTNKTFTIDFDNHTYTVTAPAAGSNGTKNQAFQILQGQTVTMKNGTVKIDASNLVSDNGKISRVIQNYANLTLDHMRFDDKNLAWRSESQIATGALTSDAMIECDNGTVNLINGTTLTIKEENRTSRYALAIEDWNSSYPGGSQVVVDGATINGNIRFYSDGATASDLDSTLTIKTNTLNGKIYDNAQGVGGQRISETIDSYELCVVEPNVYVIAQPVAKIETANKTTHYASLASAVADVPKDGTQTTIIMVDNEVLSSGVEIASTKNIVLDLNGKIVSSVKDEAAGSALIKNSGTLTIEDNSDNHDGKLTTEAIQPDLSGVPGYANNTITNHGTLYIKGGSIVNTSSKGAACYAIDNQNYGGGNHSTLVITGGSVTSTGKYAIRMWLHNTIKNDVTITGGNVKSIWVQEGKADCIGSLTIKNVTIHGDVKIGYDDVAENFVLDIQDSTFEGLVQYELDATKPGNIITFKNNTYTPFYMTQPSKILDDGTYIINNEVGIGWVWVETGTEDNYPTSEGLRIDLESKYPEDETGNWYQGYVTINGQLDRFDTYIKDGYVKVKIAEDTYVIKKATCKLVRDNGDTKYYYTLQEAVNNAQNNDTIVMLSNVTLNEGIDINKTIKLDLNGKTIDTNNTTTSYTKDYVFDVNHGGNLTIDGKGTIDSKEVMCAIKMTTAKDGGETYKAVLTVNSGNIIGKEYGISGNGNTGRGNTQITINGGTIKAKSTYGSGVDSTGIYQPQIGTLTINGGLIIGNTGVYVKNGTVKITDGIIESNGKEKAYNAPNNNGASCSGYALVVERNPNYTGMPSVKVTGGTFKTLTDTSKTVESINVNDLSDPVKNFISGGKFDKDVVNDYVVSTMEDKQVGSWWTIVDKKQTTGGNLVDVQDTKKDDNIIYKKDVASEETTIEEKTEKAMVAKVVENATPAIEYEDSKILSENKIDVEKVVENLNETKTVVEPEDSLKFNIKVDVTAAKVEIKQGASSTAEIKEITYDVKPVVTIYDETGNIKEIEKVKQENLIVQNENILKKLSFVLPIDIEMNSDIVEVLHKGEEELDFSRIGFYDVQIIDGKKCVVVEADTYSDYKVKVLNETPIIKAQIGDVKYSTLKDAIAHAKAGEVVELLEDETGEGIVIDIAGDLTIDLGNHTYTIASNLVGSSGTATNGMQLLENSGTITIKNGKITSAEDIDNGTNPNECRILIQNYRDLVLDSVVLDGSNLKDSRANRKPYTLSNNSGSVTVKDTTITAKDGNYAFDTCKYASYSIPTVKVEGSSVINGVVEASGGRLNVSNGTFNGTISKASGYASGDITISGGTFANEVLQEYCAPGFEPETIGDGRYGVDVKEMVVVAERYNAKGEKLGVYEKLITAINDAKAGETIKVVKDCSLSETTYIDDRITLDLNGHNINVGLFTVFGSIIDTCETKGTLTASKRFVYLKVVEKANDSGEQYFPVKQGDEEKYKFYETVITSYVDNGRSGHWTEQDGTVRAQAMLGTRLTEENYKNIVYNNKDVIQGVKVHADAYSYVPAGETEDLNASSQNEFVIDVIFDNNFMKQCFDESGYPKPYVIMTGIANLRNMTAKAFIESESSVYKYNGVTMNVDLNSSLKRPELNKQ